MTLPLTIPQPAIFTADGSPCSAGQVLPSAQDPVTVKLGPLRRGAVPVDIAELKAFTLQVLRREGAGPWQVLQPVPLQYQPAETASPWQAQVVCMGAPGTFSESVDGSPAYAVRAAFTLKDGQMALSSPSAPFLLPGAPTPPRIDLLVKTPGGHMAGLVTIEQDGKLTLTNQAGARVVLDGAGVTMSAGGATVTLTGGNIHLTPADPDGWIILNKRTRIEGVWEHPTE
jgi:hypothetical protein